MDSFILRELYKSREEKVQRHRHQVGSRVGSRFQRYEKNWKSKRPISRQTVHTLKEALLVFKYFVVVSI